MRASASKQVRRARWFAPISSRPRFLFFNPCILRECAKASFHQEGLCVKTYHSPEDAEHESMRLNSFYCGWRLGKITVTVCFSVPGARKTCFYGFNFYLDHVATPRVGCFGHGRVRWCSLPWCPRLHIFQARATLMFFCAAHHWQHFGSIQKVVDSYL